MAEKIVMAAEGLPAKQIAELQAALLLLAEGLVDVHAAIVGLAERIASLDPAARKQLSEQLKRPETPETPETTEGPAVGFVVL